MEIKPGQTYQHFKGEVYWITTVAWHTGTGNPMVIYEDCYGSVWARPLDEFLSVVDRDKYPNARQTYRFELMEGDSND